jgi:hypothetical protein
MLRPVLTVFLVPQMASAAKASADNAIAAKAIFKPCISVLELPTSVIIPTKTAEPIEPEIVRNEAYAS